MLFVGSGCAALIYEIVWLQLLQLVIGSTAVSLGVLLGTFMGGMCPGSLLLPRLVSARRHPLRVYAVLELGIGAIGLAVLFGMPYVEEVYALCRPRPGGHPAARGRGRRLPAAADDADGRDAAGDRALGRDQPRWASRGWASSTAATSPGPCSAACSPGSTCCASTIWPRPPTSPSAINVTVAAIALALAAGPARYEVPAEPRDDRERGRAAGAWAVYLAIALSGMSALGAEVVWTRLLSLLLGGTVYTFSLILAVFLIGLGIGSSVGAFLARRARRRGWRWGSASGSWPRPSPGPPS